MNKISNNTRRPESRRSFFILLQPRNFNKFLEEILNAALQIISLIMYTSLLVNATSPELVASDFNQFTLLIVT
jgi:hypothetical protein